MLQEARIYLCYFSVDQHINNEWIFPASRPISKETSLAPYAPCSMDLCVLPCLLHSISFFSSCAGHFWYLCFARQRAWCQCRAWEAKAEQEWCWLIGTWHSDVLAHWENIDAKPKGISRKERLYWGRYPFILVICSMMLSRSFRTIESIHFLRKV